MAVTGPQQPTPQQADDGELLRRVRPRNWENPAPKHLYDLVILGGGPAGLAACALAVRLGLEVALVERYRLGGNSLNAGSVPSKTLIRTALIRATKSRIEDLGISSVEDQPLDFDLAMARVRRIRTRISEYTSIDRLQAKGVDVFFGDARFGGSDVLIVEDKTLSFKKALVATGAKPQPPTIPGLDALGYYTSETIFDIKALPKRLAVIGGGPLGCEAAQAFGRLGSKVTILQNEPKFLPQEERDASQLLSFSLARDGIDTRLNTTVRGVRLENGVKMVDAENYDYRYSIPTDEILLSVGRVPAMDGLGLEIAGIDSDPATGIVTDDFLRTSNPRVYAAGDVCLALKFANVAEATGRMAIYNAFARGRHRLSKMTIPWCTYCDPEIAHVGLHVWDASELSIPMKSYTVMMQDVDRAITDGQEDGFVKIHVKVGTDKILGATIVASRASEMINEISVAMSTGIGMRDLAKVLHTYPAQSDAIRLAALAYIQDRPLPWIRRVYARYFK